MEFSISTLLLNANIAPPNPEVQLVKLEFKMYDSLTLSINIAPPFLVEVTLTKVQPSTSK